MKKFKTIIAILALSFATVVPATASTLLDPTPKEAKVFLRAEISKLLGQHSYDLEENSLEGEVSVLLNNDNQLVVVGVKTENGNLEDYVKSKLNYKKVSIKGIKKGVVFRLPVKLAPTS